MAFNTIRNKAGLVPTTAIFCLLAAWTLSARDWVTESRRYGEIHWQIADWFINYDSGFVRRGLGGYLLFSTGLKGQYLVDLVVLVQLTLFASLIFISLYFFLSRERNRAWLLLLLSPAFLLFPVINPGGGFRKELIALNSFGLLLIATKKESGRILLIALSLFIFSVLLHEASAVLIPAISIILISNVWVRNNRKLRYFSMILVLFAFAGFVLSIAIPINDSKINMICEAWTNAGLMGCKKAGPIYSLGQDWSYTRGVILKDLFPGYWGYLFPIVISFVPLTNLGIFKKRHLFSWVVVTSFLPLFTAVWDYGRLIFFLISILSLFALASEEIHELKFEPTWFILAAYCLLWGIGAYGDQTDQIALLPTLLARWQVLIFR